VRDADPTQRELTPANANAERRPAASAEPSRPQGAPEWIGPYHLLAELGRGGMGRVYLAEQTAPVRRQVAIKLVLGGVASEEVLYRFESERQALALMNHPNIAQIYDAGTTPEGAPFFVMEHVPGEPITRYADRHALGVEARLRLFLLVCGAIQHAHRRGILHRDIKPSNVMIAEAAEGPAPKVIDFGLAKALSSELGPDPLHTRFGILIGTPSYMSPEQCTLGGPPVDTRTDVYGLGALLYELLSGGPPFDAARLSATPLDQMVRMIREEEPPRPSRRLEDSIESGKIERSAAVEERRRALVRDLDWVVLKALEKNPDRRYGSAEDLGRDIARFLANEPVEARRPTVGYRARRYARRHRVLIAGSAATVALVGASLGWGLHRSRQEAARANREAEAAGQISSFMVDLFRVADPGQSRGSTITAREILDNGAAKLEHQLSDQPLVRAQLLDTIGTVYIQLGLYDRAGEIADQALGLRERTLGPDDLDVATSLETRAWVHFLQDQNALSLPLLERGLAIRERALGPEHLDVARSLGNIASVERELRQYDAAEANYHRAIGIFERRAPDDPELAGLLSNLTTIYADQHRWQLAEPLHRRALELRRRVLGDRHPQTAMSLNNFGWMLYRGAEGKPAQLAEAEQLLREALSTNEKILGPEHPDLALNLCNLGLLETDAGRLAEAEPLLLRALEIREKALPADHRNIGHSLFALGRLRARQGRPAEARPLLERALAILEKSPSPFYPTADDARDELARLAAN
jgi:serine/threonine protein kinase